MMQPKTTTPPPPQISIADIYHVIFKHKWKIIILSALGIGAAVAMWFKMPPPYTSEAKLLIRYVEDTKAPAASAGPDTQVKQLDPRAEAALATEADIISSPDVAASVVDAIGVDKILGKGAVATNREAAALEVTKHLKVEVPKKGNVLYVSYSNPDFTVVQSVLRKLIDSYYKKHVEIHKNPTVFDEFLTQETDKLRLSLTETEEKIRELKKRSDGVPVEEMRKVYSDRYVKLRQELDSAQADLSERVEALKVMQKSLLVDAAASPVAAPTVAVTNVAPVEPKPKLPPDVVNEYKRVLARLDDAYKRVQQLQVVYTEESTPVKNQRTVIAEIEAKKKELETATPRLLEDEVAVTVRREQAFDQRASQPKPTVDLTAEYAKVAALQARVKTLTDQFDKLKAGASLVDDIEVSYAALQLKKEQQEKQYKSFSTSLDQARIDSQLGAGKLNLSEIQSPSLPLRDMKSLQKKMAIAAVGGIGGGLALAFLLELVLGQAVRKPSDLETAYNLPVFLTIPYLDGIAKREPLAALPGVARAALPAPVLSNGESANGDGSAIDSDDNSDGSAIRNPQSAIRNGESGHALEKRQPTVEIAPWDEHHDLHPYSEALRDRLISHFEMKGLTHKPKLVALTSCSKGAGVTTLAAGLAASLSETGEGNVLLVDMNLERGAAHPFYRGKPAIGIAEVLDANKRQDAQVQENLYVVQGTGVDDRLPKVLPKRLAHLIPKLHASDYDYIIFDMPPVTQTSVTPRLAGFMDMVFMVVEDQKTNRDWLKQASGLLQQSKANVGAVYNKRRTYAPRWLHQEF